MIDMVKTLVNDIFAMRFDVVVPISGCLVAVLLGLILFLIRYVGYNYNRRRYEARKKKEERAAARQAQEEKSRQEAADSENLKERAGEL